MTQPLRIAIESTVLLKDSPTGIARYASGLLGGFQELAAADDTLGVTQICKLSRWKQRQRLPVLTKNKPQLWHDLQPAFTRPFDVVHATARWLPGWSGPLRVATIHDVYAAVGINYDDSVERHKQIGYFTHLARRAQRVICVSAHTRSDFHKHFEFAPDRAHVVHLGVDQRFSRARPERSHELRQRYCGGEPYLLFLGYFRPNKNLERLIQAYARCPMQRQYRLLIGGSLPPADKANLQKLARALGIAERISVSGYLDEADLPDLYAGASGFMFPSLYEGFGLPILEAMAAGTPVLTSTAGSCPEVANGHAVLIDPHSIDDMARGITECVAMSRDRIEAARHYAGTKTWLETARRTTEIYRIALQNA